MPRQRTRTEPRISVNKLGEYLTATSAARRRAILQQQKYPADFMVTLYNDCFDPMLSFFEDPVHDPVPVKAAIQAIQARAAANDHERTCKAINSEALGHLLHAAAALPILNMSIRRAPERASHLIVEGVEISVRPELEIVVSEGRGASRYGSLKIYLGKTHPLTPEGARLIASLVRLHAEHKFGGPEAVDGRHCYVFDVFNETLTSAPTSFTRRRNEIRVACSDIAAIWPTL